MSPLSDAWPLNLLSFAITGASTMTSHGSTRTGQASVCALHAIEDAKMYIDERLVVS